jgi:hypothetical protein
VNVGATNHVRRSATVATTPVCFVMRVKSKMIRRAVWGIATWRHPRVARAPRIVMPMAIAVRMWQVFADTRRLKPRILAQDTVVSRHQVGVIAMNIAWMPATVATMPVTPVAPVWTTTVVGADAAPLKPPQVDVIVILIVASLAIVVGMHAYSVVFVIRA